MAEQNNAPELDEEIDETEGTSDSPNAEQPGDRSEGTATAEPAGSSNKWDSIPSLSELLNETEAGKSAATDSARDAKGAKPGTGAAKAGKADDVDDEEQDPDGDEEDEDDDEEEDDDAADDRAGKGAKGTSRFEIRDAGGKKFEFALGDGMKISFDADGKTLEFDNLNDVVQLAQKGAAFDRVTSRQGQELGNLRTRSAQLEEMLDEAETTLLKALYDKGTRDKLRVALKDHRKLLDPDVREGHRAKQREAERTEAEKADREREHEEHTNAFWTKVGQQIAAYIPKFDYLTTDDAMDIATAFHAGFEREFERSFAAAKGEGKSDEEAARIANQQAATVLTPKNLRRTMRELNARHAKRFERGARGTGKTPQGDEARARQVVDRHNTTVDSKRQRREAAPPRISSTAAPRAGAKEPKPAPTTYKGRMEQAFGFLHELRTGD